MKRISEFLSPEECGLILKISDQRTIQGKRDFAILKLMLNTGLRKQEVCNLKIGDVELYNNQHCILVKNGKGGKARRQPIGDITVLSTIHTYRRAISKGSHSDNPASPLFLTLGKFGSWKQRGITPIAIDGIVRKYAKLALIKKRITPHSLRHTFCTLGLRSGIDLVTMKNLMGHSSIGATQIYLHSDEQRAFEAVKKLDFA